MNLRQALDDCRGNLLDNMGTKLLIQPDMFIVPPSYAKYFEQIVKALGKGNWQDIMFRYYDWECSGWMAIPRNLYGNPLMFPGDSHTAYKYYSSYGDKYWKSTYYNGSWEEMLEYYYCPIKVEGEWIW